MMQNGKKRRRPVQAIFKDGIEAALRADPGFLATTDTRTAMGRIIRELVLEAGRGKMTPLKVMLSLLDFEEEEAEEAVTETAPVGEFFAEPQWDWTGEGCGKASPKPRRSAQQPSAWPKRVWKPNERPWRKRLGKTLPKTGKKAGPGRSWDGG